MATVTKSGPSEDEQLNIEAVQDIEALIDLPPTHFPCLDAKPGTNPSWQSTEIPFRHFTALQSFCDQYKVSSSSVLQTAWALLLRSYVGNPSVCFACQVHEAAAGTGKLLLQEPVDGICKVEIDGEVPAMELVKTTRVTRSSFSPYQSSYLDTLPANTLLLLREDKEHDWLSVEGRECRDRGSQRLNDPQVILDISFARSEIFATLNYLPSTLSFVSASNVASVYVQAIHEIISQPNQRVKDLDILSPRDLEQLKMWNQLTPEKVNACVHDLVLSHAETSPQAPAVCSWDGELTYQELEKASSNLAKQFIGAGISQESLVPVCFQKSINAIVAMVAIHRAGGAFVPLDPSHPQDRLRAVIDKARTKVIVASPETASLFRDIDVDVIRVSSSMMEPFEGADGRSLPVVQPHHAAFVLFTSGSTGKPKGILQEHASVCTSSLAHGRALLVSSTSRVFQYAAFTFDVSMMDVFTTLICGGCVCIPSEEERMGSFTSVMNRMRVNWVLFTPSVASLISPEDVPTLETLVYGGEAVKSENVSRWVGKVRLFNCYGPAECGACAVGEFARSDARPANIGRQFGGELCWVVDPENHNRLLPIGAPGELVVEGPTLARGYLDDLAKTQASFIKSPAWPKGAGSDRARRIYKTGDLVRQNSDGTFDFVGRKDLQVKVRGQRVEIGEVEHHISMFPGIALSMVARPQAGPYEYTLVAIMQLVSSTAISLGSGDQLDHLPNKHVLAANFDREELLDSLKAKLPIYMVPTHVLVVTRLPLSVSGKIERKAVDAWLIRTSRPIESVSPSNSLQNLLPQDHPIALDLCSTVLSLVSEPESVFFKSLDGTDFPLAAVGLDSIKMIKLIMLIRQRFEVKISLEVLMNAKSSIGSISCIIADLSRDGKIMPVERKINLMDTFEAYKKKALGRVAGSGTALMNVMLTGATGFLGSRVLRDLCLNQKVYRIMVHVRSSSAQKALQRIIQSAILVGWWKNEYSQKIDAWAGDLAKPRLGLTPDQWNRLCGHGSRQDRVTAIIHNGATVNWNANFSALKATNVDSTVDLLKAASESAVLSDFVFISGGQQLRTEADNDLDIAEEVGWSNGYAQTKFLSELMVKEYARSVAPRQQRISIVKPGYIIGGVDDGICITDDFIWRLTASCADIGSYNAEDACSWLFVSDVNRVAATITHCCSAAEENLPYREARIVKIFDGLTVSDYWNIVKHEMKCEIRPLRADTWAKRLYADIESRGEQHPLWPLLETVERGQGKIGTSCRPQQMTGHNDRRVRAAIQKNIEYLKSIGFLSRSSEDLKVRKDKATTMFVRTPFAIKA
ncbi:MAG: hypothetical protein Q9170_005952 [Blastenia crenularia]